MRKRIIRPLTITFIIFIATACTPLTAQQQYERDLRRAQAAEIEQQQRYILAQAKQNAPFGSRVQCSITNGTLYTRRGHVQVIPIALDLLQSHDESFTITPRHRDHSWAETEGYASFDGQTIELCQFNGFNSPDTCAKLVANRNDLARGINHFLYSDRFIRGNISCSLPGIL